MTNINLRAVVENSPRLLEGVTLEDVRYFMDIAAQEQQWRVARALKAIIEAAEARLKEEAEEVAAIDAEMTRLAKEAKNRMFFADGFNGYVTFAPDNVILLQDYCRGEEGETLRAEKEIHVGSYLWNKLLQMGREGYAVDAEDVATCRILRELTGEGEMWPFAPEDYRVIARR